MLQAGAKAPPFKLHLLSDGAVFDLFDQLESGPVMLVIAKVNCPTCRYALPILERARRRSSGPGGRMLLVLQELPLVARDFVQEISYLGNAVADEAPYAVSRAYRISFVPSAYYISSDGRIERRAESFDRDELAAMVDLLARENGKAPGGLEDGGREVPAFRPG